MCISRLAFLAWVQIGVALAAPSKNDQAKADPARTDPPKSGQPTTAFPHARCCQQVAGQLDCSFTLEQCAAASQARDEKLANQSRRELPGPEVALPPAQVVDPLFAYLIGLLTRDQLGRLTGIRLRAVVGMSGRRSAVPLRPLAGLARVYDPGTRSRWVDVAFDGEQSIPVPYRVLGYSPGAIVFSPLVRLLETHSQGLTVGTPPITVSPLYHFTIIDGRAFLDLDAAVETLLRPALDDCELLALGLFADQGHWYGVAVGTSPQGEPVYGVLDLAADQVIFPAPAPYLVVAATIREQALADRAMLRRARANARAARMQGNR